MLEDVLTTVPYSLLHYARWAALGVIFLAPWPYACIPTWTHPWLYGVEIGIGVLWAIGLAMRRQRPAIPRVVLFCVGWLLVHGWLLIANAQYAYDWEKYAFVPAHPWWAGQWVPGALDIVAAVPTMLRVSGLLVILCVFMDMAPLPHWRRRMLSALVISGVALVAYGLLQRMLHQPLLLWREWDLGHNLFASFFYHANAGAFVNLLLPLVVGLTTVAFCRRENHSQRSILLGSLVMTLAAVVAIASKGAMLVTVVVLPSAGYLAFRYAREKKVLRSRQAMLQIAAGAAIGLAGAILFGLDRSAERWSEAVNSMSSESPRLAAWRGCLRMLGDAGPWGIGPGNFPLAFPHYTKGLSATMGVWEHAHQDYLETCIEWGWVGALVWGTLLGGALGQLLPRPSQPAAVGVTDRLLTRLAGISLAGVLLHSLVDFPLQIPAIQVYTAAILSFLWVAPKYGDAPAIGPHQAGNEDSQIEDPGDRTPHSQLPLRVVLEKVSVADVLTPRPPPTQD